jgi:hypothetical protein
MGLTSTLDRLLSLRRVFATLAVVVLGVAAGLALYHVSGRSDLPQTMTAAPSTKATQEQATLDLQMERDPASHNLASDLPAEVTAVAPDARSVRTMAVSGPRTARHASVASHAAAPAVVPARSTAREFSVAPAVAATAFAEQSLAGLVAAPAARFEPTPAPSLTEASMLAPAEIAGVAPSIEDLPSRPDEFELAFAAPSASLPAVAADPLPTAPEFVAPRSGIAPVLWDRPDLVASPEFAAERVSISADAVRGEVISDRVGLTSVRASSVNEASMGLVALNDQQLAQVSVALRVDDPTSPASFAAPAAGAVVR